MRFTGTLKKPRINAELTKRRITQHLEKQVQRGAEIWLKAVLKSIPVWSGASVSTFTRLALLANAGSLINASPVANAPDRTSQGVAQSGAAIVNDGNGKIAFEYNTTLAHLVYNEFNNANITPDPGLFAKLKRPGPYRFQLIGALAFGAFAQTVRLPVPTVTVRTRKI